MNCKLPPLTIQGRMPGRQAAIQKALSAVKFLVQRTMLIRQVIISKESIQIGRQMAATWVLLAAAKIFLLARAAWVKAPSYLRLTQEESLQAKDNRCLVDLWETLQPREKCLKSVRMASHFIPMAPWWLPRQELLRRMLQIGSWSTGNSLQFWASQAFRTTNNNRNCCNLGVRAPTQGLEQSGILVVP